jgi:four helix bundle protein
MKSYKDLEVWKKSFNLAKAIYLLSTKLPKTEQFAITSQIQRAAVSIPSNLAEGQQRSSSREFAHFISISRGSVAELITQLELIQDIYKIDCGNEIAQADEVGKMLYALERNIKER